ncbi:MAG: hypothetical protein DRJ51_08385 [Thermoprotei archaeon]|nr:MAG: hypothetical protein DRJ51_08385 [Thermoprotei archaeon]
MSSVEVISIGNLGLSLLLNVDSFPPTTYSTKVRSLEIIGGIEATSIAVGLSRLETVAGVIGSIGDDWNGMTLKQMLEKEGVDLSHVKLIKGGKTGLCIYIKDPKGRIWNLTYKGVNEEWGSELVDEEYVKSARAIYVTGDVFTDKRRSLVFKILRTAKDYGKTVFFNIGPSFLSTESGILSNLRALIDYWLLNEDQAIELLGTLSNSALRFFLKKMEAKAIFIKLDTEGSYVFAKNVSQKFPLQKKVIRDVLGISEAYDVGFIYGILNGYDLEGAARIANVVAAFKLEGTGPWNLPRVEDISNYL